MGFIPTSTLPQSYKESTKLKCANISKRLVSAHSMSYVNSLMVPKSLDIPIV